MKMHSHSNRLAEFGIRPRLPFASTPNRQLNPIIITLVGYLEKLDTPHALDLAVEAAYKKTPEFMDNFNITGANSFLDFANDLLRWIPHEHSGGRDIYDILCMFYFVFNQSPLKDLQTPIHPGAVGQPLTWLSSWLVVYSQLVGFWMDSPESLTKESLESFWESPLYKLEEAQEPPRGWKTFNELFSRKLKVGARPIESPDDDTVIVYPADCKYDTSAKDHSAAVFPTGIISIKGLPWSIGSLLEDSEYGSEFNGGVWMHAFLNTYNYHRQHAPVAGKVLEARTVQGTCYFEVDEGEPQSAVMRSEPYSPNSPGYQFFQTRGIIIIENPTVGKVAVLPVGMALISGVKLSVSKGDTLKKGDEISKFLFGGSDIVCVFQSKANLTPDSFVPSPEGSYEYSRYGTELAKTRRP